MRHSMILGGSLLLCFACVAAQAKRHVVESAQGVVALHCAAGDTVEINAAGAQATITGTCAAVHVNGADNDVRVESVGEVSIDGSGNAVQWQRSIDGRAPLVTRMNGAGSFLRQNAAMSLGTQAAPAVAASSSVASDADPAPRRSGGSPQMTGSDQSFEYDCAGDDVVNLTGSGNRIDLRGDCDTVNVYGSDNTVHAEALGIINVTGVGNQVFWSRGAQPRLNQTGSGNRLAKKP
ncbi:DUF3060 domain-containing protein [Dokdonella sp.]|uniref:DUF3060 domain-containing protein n=1 Tax=Dokdonella sp. TaxID=2291710 RepID=UPI001B117621|nr:DUF3060 domain-containing protein [Dokdonella sp.]MBO9661766.1 DUF3060 domain-containing protein [Dokdonella sp.]